MLGLGKEEKRERRRGEGEKEGASEERIHPTPALTFFLGPSWGKSACPQPRNSLFRAVEIPQSIPVPQQLQGGSSPSSPVPPTLPFGNPGPSQMGRLGWPPPARARGTSVQRRFAEPWAESGTLRGSVVPGCPLSNLTSWKRKWRWDFPGVGCSKDEEEIGHLAPSCAFTAPRRSTRGRRPQSPLQSEAAASSSVA